MSENQFSLRDNFRFQRDYKYEPYHDLPSCKMGDWGNVGTCSKSCGGGEQVQSRQCNGNSCGSADNMRTIDCNEQKCRDKWGGWGPWGNCSKPCGGGKQQRDRMMMEGPRRGDRDTEDQDCNEQPCPPPPSTGGGGGQPCNGAFWEEGYWTKGCFMSNNPISAIFG